MPWPRPLRSGMTEISSRWAVSSTRSTTAKPTGWPSRSVLTHARPAARHRSRAASSWGGSSATASRPTSAKRRPAATPMAWSSGSSSRRGARTAISPPVRASGRQQLAQAVGGRVVQPDVVVGGEHAPLDPAVHHPDDDRRVAGGGEQLVDRRVTDVAADRLAVEGGLLLAGRLTRQAVEAADLVARPVEHQPPAQVQL